MERRERVEDKFVELVTVATKSKIERTYSKSKVGGRVRLDGIRAAAQIMEQRHNLWKVESKVETEGKLT